MFFYNFECWVLWWWFDLPQKKVLEIFATKFKVQAFKSLIHHAKTWDPWLVLFRLGWLIISFRVIYDMCSCIGLAMGYHVKMSCFGIVVMDVMFWRSDSCQFQTFCYDLASPAYIIWCNKQVKILSNILGSLNQSLINSQQLELYSLAYNNITNFNILQLFTIHEDQFCKLTSLKLKL